MCSANWLGEVSKQVIFGVSSHGLPCQKIDLSVLSCSLTVRHRIEPRIGFKGFWGRAVFKRKYGVIPLAINRFVRADILSLIENWSVVIGATHSELPANCP